MKRFALATALLWAPFSAFASPSVSGIVADHILPRFEALAGAAQDLALSARADCAPTSANLRAAYHTAFDAWVSASHLRFGPTEIDERAFALAFWPDSRGATPRTLTGLITQQDPIALDPDAFSEVSIAARGFYALEFLLYDDALMEVGTARFRCRLVQTVTADIAATAGAIHEDWMSGQVDVLLSPGPQSIYRTEEDVLQDMLRALSTGLQFTQDTRLGRPLGTYDRPRPTRAEAWRSGRSRAHVVLSLSALQDLAARLSASDARLSARLAGQFDAALSRLDTLNDPVFAGVAAPQSRIRIEAISQAIGTIRATVQTDLGPTLGVVAGFNALDGD